MDRNKRVDIIIILILIKRVPEKIKLKGRNYRTYDIYFFPQLIYFSLFFDGETLLNILLKGYY